LRKFLDASSDIGAKTEDVERWNGVREVEKGECEDCAKPLVVRAEGARIPRTAIRAPACREVADFWMAES
jgi:hypothetical protein